MWRRSMIVMLCLVAIVWIGIAFWIGSWVIAKFIFKILKSLNWATVKYLMGF